MIDVKIIGRRALTGAIERAAAFSDVARGVTTHYVPSKLIIARWTMAAPKPNYSTPSAIRSVTSYPAHRGFKQAVDPALDRVAGVEDAIDIHCHAHEGQQDALGVAKPASVTRVLRSISSRCPTAFSA
jgi:hypothetical protein